MLQSDGKMQSDDNSGRPSHAAKFFSHDAKFFCHVYIFSVAPATCEQNRKLVVTQAFAVTL